LIGVPFRDFAETKIFPREMFSSQGKSTCAAGGIARSQAVQHSTTRQFSQGYRAAYATIYDRNDDAAAIEQLKALTERRQPDRLFLSQTRRLRALSSLVRARAESRRFRSRRESRRVGCAHRCLKMTGTVEKVEERAAPKISRRSVFSPLHRCKALQHSY
jgi:hypothetical protein